MRRFITLRRILSWKWKYRCDSSFEIPYFNTAVQLSSYVSRWHTYTHTHAYIHIYEDPLISFQTFFVWALLLIVHTWNSSPLRSKLLRLQCICCTVLRTSGRFHGSPLVWACQWPSSQPLSAPQLSHNDSLWA